MSRIDAVTRAATLTASACTTVIGALTGRDGSYSDLDVHEAPVDAWVDVAFPLVSVQISFTTGIIGDNLFVLTPDQARTLAAAMMGLTEPEATGELNEIELSAVSEAMNQMMGSVATAMADAIGQPTDIATPTTSILEDRAAAAALGEAAYSARFTLHAGEVASQIIQLIPAEFAAVLDEAFATALTANVAISSAHRQRLARLTDETYNAVERTARITAESSADVLSTLLNDRVTATLPEIEAAPDDPLGALSYPLITVEVSYVAGVNGANLFALTPPQAATLAAVMMGADDAHGDGLSELELSAVGEAMNQMMGAATNVLADTLSLDIEVAPPVTQVINSADEARAVFEHPAYCARFRIVSDRLAADVVQLVPADFALHLQQAFSAADYGRTGTGASAVVSPPPAATADTNAQAAQTPPGALALEAFRRVEVRVSAELGRSHLEVARVLNLPPGSIVTLDRDPNDPIDLLINGRPFAQARLVLVDGEYAAQILSIAPPAQQAA
jgi:flagellar motor switch protein FliN